jgi:hypothetical protein
VFAIAIHLLSELIKLQNRHRKMFSAKLGKKLDLKEAQHVAKFQRS